MSEADPMDVRLVAERDGVRVQKRFEPDDFPVPAMAFEVDSGRDEPVTVRIVDDVPDPVAPEDIGFHPDYGGEFWAVESDHIVFERSIEPGEPYTTVYGLRSESDSVEQYLSEPTIDQVDPPAATSDGGDGDLSLDLPEDEVDADSSAGPSLPSDPPDASDEDETGATIEAADLDSAAIAEALADGLRRGDVSDGTVATLREEFGADAPGRVGARVDRIQSDVADLRAYTDALEEFLDENGDAQQLLRDLEDRLDEISADADRHGERIDELRADVESLSDAIERLEDDLARIEDVKGQLDDVRDDLDTLAEMREQLSSVFTGHTGSGGE